VGVLVVGCSSPDTELPGSYVDGAGAADAAWLRERELAWARFETKDFHAYSPVNALAQLARVRLEPGYRPPGVFHAGDWDAAWRSLDTLDDGRDFTGLYLLNVLLGPDDPSLAPDLKPRIEQSLLGTKLWYTHPTPAGLTDVAYYWSENHQAIYRTLEYLLGRRYPNIPIGTDGALGRDHAASAKAFLLRWMDHRLRFGFAEWHSNVYYQKDITPMLTLVQWADEDDVATRAQMVLDVLFVDLATHTLGDAFGVTHGRSYKKNKMTAGGDDTWDLTKMIFAQSSSTYDWDGDDPGAAVFAATTRYTFPEVVRRIGADKAPMVDRERMSIPIPEAQPVDATVETGAYGFRYDDPDDLMIWWGMGALTAWPVVPATLAELDRYGLWDNPSFRDYQSFRQYTPDFVQNLSASASAMIDFALMKEVDTYTWRTPDVMLSSAVDYRKGTFNQQLHAWQATLDARAIVFTNHPFRPLADSGDWLDDPESGGYWTGEASAPRSAQSENVAIHLYAPQYGKTNAPPFDFFRWEPYTHAYFPQEYFDEIAQRGNWTFGRLGAGYVGLWSWRAPRFLVYDGVKQATGGRVKPFDLLADGGADDVWIVEVGRAEGGSFQAFVDALAGAAITVAPLGPGKPTGESDGFDVVYDSPSQGRITFGWNAPLTVRGAIVPMRGPGRHDSPYAHIPQDPKETPYAWQLGPYGIRHDIARARRIVYGP
jgi:hypothetical protein